MARADKQPIAKVVLSYHHTTDLTTLFMAVKDNGRCANRRLK